MEIAIVIVLGIMTFMLTSIAGSLAKIEQRFQRPEFKPGDEVWVSAFGQETKCVVIASEGGKTLLHPVTGSSPS